MKQTQRLRDFVTVLIFVVYGCARPAPPPPVAAPPPPPPAPPVEAPAPAPPPPAARNGPRAAPPGAFNVVSVFYGTDRDRTGDSTPSNFYGSLRGSVELGTCEVSIPFSHKIGRLETPFFKVLASPARHVLLLGVTPVSKDQWLADVRWRVTTASHKEAFIFVHGYNVSFEDACRRTGQLAHDLKFSGAPIMWSWPADGKTASYFKDETDVEWSADHFQSFLTLVAQETGAQTVHLIAHSMGNRALITAIANLVRTAGSPTRPLFNQVILTAPDIDRDVFIRLAVLIRLASARTTLYASSNDKALMASKLIHGYPRAGDAGDNIVVLEGVETIDVSLIDTSLVGHSYYGDKVSVISDIFNLLLHRKPPDERFHLHKRVREGRTYWEFRAQ